VQAKLDGLMEAFEKGGSLGILQAIASDKNLPVEIRVRAAGLAVPYERAKPVSTTLVGVVDIHMVKAARLKQEAKDRARWAALRTPPKPSKAPSWVAPMSRRQPDPCA
jgi:hypothetical protein